MHKKVQKREEFRKNKESFEDSYKGKVDERWQVSILKEDKLKGKCKISVVSIEKSVDKVTNLQQTRVSLDEDGVPDSEDVSLAILRIMMTTLTKPNELAFTDKRIYKGVRDYLKSLNCTNFFGELQLLKENKKLEKLSEISRSSPSSPPKEAIVRLNKTQVFDEDGNSTILRQRSITSTRKEPGNNFLESHELVESTTETEISKEVDGFEVTTSRTENRKVEIRQKSSIWTWLTTFLIFFVVVGTTLFIYYNEPTQLRSDWPPSSSLILSLANNLRTKTSISSQALNKLVSAFEFHIGKQALVINLIGDNSEAYRVIEQVSKVLFGNEISDRVLNITQDAEEPVLVKKIYNQILTWPLSVVVFEQGIISPSHLSFLTSAWNDEEPILILDWRPARTNSAIFFIITDIKLPPRIAEEDVDRQVKSYLKEHNWPDRICQRIRHSIPLELESV